MRHGKKVKKIGRPASHRRATLANLANALIRHKRINTTVARAKALRMYVEPLITKSKVDSTHNRRTVFSYLKDKYAIQELFAAVSTKVGERPGGYTRILKISPRPGDNSQMAMIELVDFNETYIREEKKAGKKRTRRGRDRKPEEEPKARPTGTQEEPVTATAGADDQPAATQETAAPEASVAAGEEAVPETPGPDAPESPEDEAKTTDEKS